MNTNNFFIIPKSGNTNFIPDFVNQNHGELGRDMLISTIGRNLNNGTATLADLFNIKGLKNNKEIEELINKTLFSDEESESNQKIGINTPEGIKKINKLMKESIRIYEDVFYRQFPKRGIKTGFKTKNEIIKFLKLTCKGDIKAEIACFISTIILSVNEILDKPSLTNLDKKANFMIREKVVPGIQIDNYDFFKTFGIGTGSVNINNEKIDFRLRYRGKKSDKTILKLINDPDYGYGELIKDSIGIEFEVKSEKHAFLLLNRFYVSLFNELNPDGSFTNFAKRFKNKNLLTLEGLRTVISEGFQLNSNFIDLVKKGIDDTESKDKSNINYQDAKCDGQVRIPKDLNISDSQLEHYWVELRTVLVGNNNEEGLSDHRILDVLKIIFGIIRASGYIRINEVKKLINILLKDNLDLINEKGLNKDIIFNYYIDDKLLKVKSGSKILYTTKDRFNTLNGTSLYPETIKKSKK